MSEDERRPPAGRRGRPSSRAREGGAAQPAPSPGPGERADGLPRFAPGNAGRRPPATGARPVGRPAPTDPGAPTGRPPAPARTSARTPARPPVPRASAGDQPPARPGGATSGRTSTPPPARPARTARGAPPPAHPPAAGRPEAADPATRVLAGGVARLQQISPGGGPAGHPAPRPELPPREPRRVRRRVVKVVAMLLALVLAWPIGLALWADGRIEHVEALSAAAGTPGTTYLLAGSDSREDGVVIDTETLGSRTDTIMLLHQPPSGPAALISLPRDAYVEIPGNGGNKLNASFAWGGAPLLVSTVEALSGLTVDHYVEIGFGGVQGVVDAVGGVELCLDYAVNEPLSGLVWPEPGCRTADGPTALAFARMRYADPEGDVGRAKRQQQLIGALTAAAAQPSLLVRPGRQVELVRAGTDALTTSPGTGILDLGRLALAFRSATGPGGITGTPPLASLDYRPGGVGSTVQLDEAQAAGFWAGIRDGSLPPGPVGGAPPVG